jgi:hypothetical protein
MSTKKPTQVTAVNENPATTGGVASAPSETLLTAVEGEENTTVTAAEPEAPVAQEEVTPVAPAPAPAPVPNPGSEIAAAITQGMKEAKKGNTIKITVDRSVKSRFGVVRSKRTGEIMLRENETGVLSKVQLESLEEKEASIQNEEVESVRA